MYILKQWVRSTSFASKFPTSTTLVRQTICGQHIHGAPFDSAFFATRHKRLSFPCLTQTDLSHPLNLSMAGHTMRQA